MLFRAATVDDLDPLLSVQEEGAVRALSHIFPQDTYPFPRETLRRRWLAEIANPNVHVYVSEKDGVVDGFVAISGDEFLHFGTAVHTWGTGLAQLLHDAAMDQMRRLAPAGILQARLRVFEENRRDMMAAWKR